MHIFGVPDAPVQYVHISHAATSAPHHLNSGGPQSLLTDLVGKRKRAFSIATYFLPLGKREIGKKEEVDILSSFYLCACIIIIAILVLCNFYSRLCLRWPSILTSLLCSQPPTHRDDSKIRTTREKRGLCKTQPRRVLIFLYIPISIRSGGPFPINIPYSASAR